MIYLGRDIGAIIVSTPQDIALKDAIKGIAMFRKVDVSVGSSLSSSHPHPPSH